MVRWVVAIVGGSICTCTGLAGLAALSAYSEPYSAIVYDHALVLKPGTRSFESVSIGLDPHADPLLFVDDLGLGLVPMRQERDAAARWDGTGFRVGRQMSVDAHLSLLQMDADAPMGDGALLRWQYGKLTLVRPGQMDLPLELPAHYQLHTVVAAGPGRAMLVPDRDETRTYLVTLPDGAFVLGPMAPPFMSTIAGTAPDGTVVLVPGGREDEIQVRGLVLGGAATLVGAGGLVGLGALGLGRRLPLVGVVGGVVLVIALLALAVVGLGALMHVGGGSIL